MMTVNSADLSREAKREVMDLKVSMKRVSQRLKKNQVMTINGRRKMLLYQQKKPRNKRKRKLKQMLTTRLHSQTTTSWIHFRSEERQLCFSFV